MRRVRGVLVLMATSLMLTSCGTLTGIPGHGGGKRFTEEQRAVSASIRGSLEDIDISSLKGKRVALIFSLIADEGAGNITGGRASISSLISAATMFSPVASRVNQLEIFQIAGAGASQATTTSTGTGTNTGQLIIAGGNTSTAQNITNGTTSGSSQNSQTTNGTNSGTSNNATTGQSASTTTTGATTTNQTGTSSGTTNATSSGTNSSTTTGTGSTAGTNSSTTNSTGSGTNNSTQNSTGSSTSASNTNQNGSTTSTQDQVVKIGHREQTKGDSKNVGASLQYKGLGDYKLLSVPKSDASLLMSLTRNYFILNGSSVTTPTDPTAEAIVYVTVDIFGINRQRTDLLIFNQESLKAETSIEMFAADRAGRIIMRPKVGNVQTSYQEDYILWAGPFDTRRTIDQGDGLLNDFTDQ